MQMYSRNQRAVAWLKVLTTQLPDSQLRWCAARVLMKKERKHRQRKNLRSSPRKTRSGIELP
jgi:hypothetical protein